MSDFIDGIATVIGYFCRLIAGIFCTFLLLISIIDIFRWPEWFSSVRESINSGFWSYCACCLASFAILWVDFLTIFPAVIAICSWRLPYVIADVREHFNDIDDSDDFQWNPKIRGRLWINFLWVFADLPFIFMSLLTVFAPWRLPTLFVILKGSSNGSNNSRRFNIFINFLLIFWDIFTVFCAFVTIFSPLRLFAWVRMWVQYTKWNVWGRPTDTNGIAGEPRLCTLVMALLVIPDWFAMFGYAFALPFFWNWRACFGGHWRRSRYHYNGELRDREDFEERLIMSPRFFFWGWLHALVGITDLFTGLAGAIVMVSWRGPRLWRKLADRREERRRETKSMHEEHDVDAEPRLLVWQQFVLLFSDLLFGAMFVVTIVCLLRAYHVCRRLRRVAKQPIRGHDPRGWYNCNYRYAIGVEFGKTFVVFFALPLLVPLVITGYRIPICLAEMKTLREQWRLMKASMEATGKATPDDKVAPLLDSSPTHRSPRADDGAAVEINPTQTSVVRSTSADVSALGVADGDHNETSVAADELMITNKCMSREESLNHPVEDAPSATLVNVPSDEPMGAMYDTAAEDANGGLPIDHSAAPAYGTATADVAEIPSVPTNTTLDVEEIEEKALFFNFAAVIITQCVLVFVDGVFLFLLLANLVMLVRAHRQVRELVYVPSQSKSSVGWYRRESVGLNFLLSFRDLACTIFVWLLTILNPIRFVGCVVKMVSECAGKTDPTPALRLYHLSSAYETGYGWKLKVAGYVDPHGPHSWLLAAGPPSVALDVDGDTFWDRAAQHYGGFKIGAARSMLPMTFKGTSDQVRMVAPFPIAAPAGDASTTERPSPNYFAEVDCPTSRVSYNTLRKFGERVGMTTPLTVSVLFNDKKNTLAVIDTTVGSLQQAHTNAQPHTSVDLTRTDITFNARQVAGAAKETGAAAEVTAEDWAPYWCDVWWSITLSALGQTLLDLLALACFVFTHLLPTRAFFMYRDLFYNKRRTRDLDAIGAVKMLANDYKDTNKPRGAAANEGHMRMINAYEMHLNIVHKRNVSLIGGGRRNAVEQLERTSLGEETNGFYQRASQYIHHARALPVEIQSLCCLLVNNTLAFCGVVGDKFFEDMAMLLAVGGDEEGGSRWRNDALRERLLALTQASDGQQTRRTYLTMANTDAYEPFAGSEAYEATTVGAALRGRAIAPVDPSTGGTTTIPSELEDVYAVGTPMDVALIDAAAQRAAGAPATTLPLEALSDIYAQRQQAVLEAIAQFASQHQQQSGLLPSIAANHDYDEARLRCVYHAAMVFVDLLTLFALLVVCAPLYRIPTVIHYCSPRSRIISGGNWRWGLLLVAGEYLLDVVFLFLYAVCVLSLVEAVHVHRCMWRRWKSNPGYWALREGIFDALADMCHAFAKALSRIVSCRALYYTLLTFVLGLVAPIELATNHFGLERAKCCGGCLRGWMIALLGWAAIIVVPFAIVFSAPGAVALAYEGDPTLPSKNFSTKLYGYMAMVAASIVVFVVVLVIRSRRKLEVKEVISVTFRFMPLTGRTVGSFLVSVFEVAQLCALPIILSTGAHAVEGFDFNPSRFGWLKQGAHYLFLDHITRFHDHEADSAISTTVDPNTVGYYLAFSVTVLTFFVIALPVVTDTLLKKDTEMTTNSVWRAFAYVGNVMTLFVIRNVVAWANCSDQSTFLVASALDDSNGTVAYTNETRYFPMQVGEPYLNFTCWYQQPANRAAGAFTLMLVGFFAVMLVLKGVRFSADEANKGEDEIQATFHEVSDTYTVVLHMMLGSLSGLLYANPFAFCIIQAAILSLYALLHLKNTPILRAIYPVNRIATLWQLNAFRNIGYLCAIATSAICAAGLRTRQQSGLHPDNIADGYAYAIVAAWVAGIAIAILLISASVALPRTVGDDQCLTQWEELQADTKQFALQLSSEGRLVSAFNSGPLQLLATRIGKASSLDGYTRLLLELESAIHIAAYTPNFFTARAVWWERAVDLAHKGIRTSTIETAGDLLQSLKNGCTTTPTG